MQVSVIQFLAYFKGCMASLIAYCWASESVQPDGDKLVWDSQMCDSLVVKQILVSIWSSGRQTFYEANSPKTGMVAFLFVLLF